HEYMHYYNHERIQLKLKGLSPVQYRTQSLL
ncbi:MULTISPECIES: IS3 family transposase, partial [Psychrobacter]